MANLRVAMDDTDRIARKATPRRPSELSDPNRRVIEIDSDTDLDLPAPPILERPRYQQHTVAFRRGTGAPGKAPDRGSWRNPELLTDSSESDYTGLPSLPRLENGRKRARTRELSLNRPLNAPADEIISSDGLPGISNNPFGTYPTTKPRQHPTAYATDHNSDANHKRRKIEADQEKQPWYFDQKFNMEMFCGPGYESYPVALGTVEGHTEICEAFRRRQAVANRQLAAENSAQHAGWDEERITEQVQEVISDICPDFIAKRVSSMLQDQVINLSEPQQVEIVINGILEYDEPPKRTKQKKAQTKPQPATDGTGVTVPIDKAARGSPSYRWDAVTILEKHFLHIPTHYIYRIVGEKLAIYDAYLYLSDVENRYFQMSGLQRPYRRSRQPRSQLEKKYANAPAWYVRDPKKYALSINEVQAAKQHLERESIKTDQTEIEEKREAENLEQHRFEGGLVECQICFDSEIPLNRTVTCQAEEGHLFCYSCIEQLANSQIGQMKHEMKCQHGDGCKADLEVEGIAKAVPLKTFDRLAFNQQQAEITAADLDGLEECLHCDFKAILDPVETSPVFNCHNPDCGRATCRTCKEDAHTPLSCEEMKNDRGLSARHLVEEARTQSILRPCPRCKVSIIKEHGCNKMTCTKCMCLICYICKIDITKVGYEHFNKPGSKCPLYDNNTGELHAAEADAAELEAIKKVKAENADIDEKKLRIETGKPKQAPVPQNAIGGIAAGLHADLVERRRLMEAAHAGRMAAVAAARHPLEVDFLAGGMPPRAPRAAPPQPPQRHAQQPFQLRADLGAHQANNAQHPHIDIPAPGAWLQQMMPGLQMPQFLPYAPAQGAGHVYPPAQPGGPAQMDQQPGYLGRVADWLGMNRGPPYQ